MQPWYKNYIMATRILIKEHFAILCKGPGADTAEKLDETKLHNFKIARINWNFVSKGVKLEPRVPRG